MAVPCGSKGAGIPCHIVIQVLCILLGECRGSVWRNIALRRVSENWRTRRQDIVSTNGRSLTDT